MAARRTLASAVLALVALAAAPVAAMAARGAWATVNVCDTAGHPNTVGIRGSMPGARAPAAEMFTRFQVQLQRDDGSWRLLDSADSGFIDVGRARARLTRQSGQSFRLSPPAAGNVYTVRGLVTFEWRAKDGTVVRRARRVTTGAHRSTAGADPPGFSAAECTITA